MTSNSRSKTLMTLHQYVHKALTLAAATLIATVVGCGPKLSSVTGTVTYEGKTIEKGMITLTPVDGIGAIAGAPIENGKYTIDSVLPGTKIVEVAAVKTVPFTRNTEEMAKMAEQQLASGNTSGLIDPADIVPNNAKGNRAEFEIQQGLNKLDISLTKPEEPNS